MIFSIKWQRFRTIKNINIAALSDIHGQFDLFIELMTAQKIIDSDLKWNFGTGHFVITGDIFDRGDKVTDVLWFILHLEKEAEAAGGKVHYLLGNHEYMVLRNDLRYINKKYEVTSKKLKKRYDELFNETSVLGRWLRSKNTILKLNDYVFLHGGISKTFVKSNIGIEEANHIFRESIAYSKKRIKKDVKLSILHQSDGPVWYRGYFRDEEMNQKKIDYILSELDAKKIIVGHTTMSKIETRFNKKIIAIDTKIKKGKTGELLLIKNNTFYRGHLNGNLSALF